MKASAFDFLLLLLVLLLSPSQGLNPYYTTTSQVEDNILSTYVRANSDLGECTCDVTLNSCDIFCCCDSDCPSNLLTHWNNNYESFCEYNYLGQAFKANAQCIDSANLFRYNVRQGMTVSESNDQFCVQTNDRAIFSEYMNYIYGFDDSLEVQIDFDLSEILFD